MVDPLKRVPNSIIASNVFNPISHIKVRIVETPVMSKVDRKNLPLYTKAEVAAHNTVEDFWCIVMKKVYHLPAEIVEGHSGGDIIMEAAGKDATILFEDGPHGEYARNELDQHLIGRCEE